MKKVLAHIAVSALIPLTIALVACGDEKTSSVIEVDSPATSVGDTASTAIDQEMQDSSDNDSVSQKTVLANSGPCSLDRTNGGELAYLTNNEKVGYQIIIPDMSGRRTYTNHELNAERVGDTLRVLNDTDTILTWECYVYYTFNIPAEDADIKYFEYDNRGFKVVPGPAPEKAPDTSCHRIPPLDKPFEEGVYDSTFCIIATFTPSAEGVYDSTWTFFPYDIYLSSSSDSTVESSSSVSAKSSSSSAANVAGTHQIITDAVVQCKNDRRTLDRPAVFSDALLPEWDDTTSTTPAVAMRKIGDNGFDTIVIPEVTWNCGTTFDGFEVSELKIGHDTLFSNTSVLVFDRYTEFPLVDAIPLEK